MSQDLRTRLQYPREVDPVLGYAPGRVIKDDLLEYRSEQAAEAVLLHRYERFGTEGISNVMMLIDNTSTPDFFRGEEYEERYLGTKLMESRLDRATRRHLGGDNGFQSMAFNRVSAANLTAVLALTPKDSVVPYLVVPYPGDGLAGHGHPSIPRAVELAKARLEIVTTLEELRRVTDGGGVELITICPSYRGIMDESVLSGACRLGNARSIPVFVDDASGARLRTIGAGQPSAVELGADLVVTSTEKYGLMGPRAAVLLGRREQMERVGARAAVLGTEARPSVVASIIKCLEEFTDEGARALYAQWKLLHEELHEALKTRFGDRVKLAPYAGVSLMVEDIMEIAMDKASVTSSEYAPVDIATGLAMILLRRYGYMTIPALHYPGASKSLTIHMARPAAQRLGAETIAAAIDDSFDRIARIIADRERLEQLLFGPPDLAMEVVED